MAAHIWRLARRAADSCPDGVSRSDRADMAAFNAKQDTFRFIHEFEALAPFNDRSRVFSPALYVETQPEEQVSIA